MEKPLVSICVLTYQAAPYISDCIKGILSQTYSNIELLILDDASTDRTVSIIESNMKKLEEKFVRVKFIRHNVNSGSIPHNCNELMKECKGEFIKCFAGDDALSSCYIEEMIQFFQENKDCEIAYSNGYVVPDSWHLEHSGKYRSLYPECYRQPSKNLFEELLFRNFIYAVGAIYRSSVFAAYGYYDETLLYEDRDMWLRCAMNHAKFCYVDKKLVYYRASATGISRDGTRKMWIRKWNQRVQLVNKYRQFIEKENWERLMLHHISQCISSAKSHKYYDLALILWWREHKLLKRISKRRHADADRKIPVSAAWR